MSQHTPDQSAPLAWSYSRLSKFRQCQLKSFWMDYAPKHVKVVEPPNPVFEKGKKMHKVMEDALVKGTALPRELEVKEGEFVDMTHLEPVVDSLRYYDEIYTEKQIAFTQDLRETSWFGKDVWVRVIWDVAVRKGPQVHVVDYKSGRPKADADQLELFAASVFTKFPDVDTVVTHFIFLEHKKYTTDTFYRSAMPHIWQKFGEEAEQIQISMETGNWEPNPGFACKYCPVPKSKCQYSQVEG